MPPAPEQQQDNASTHSDDDSHSIDNKSSSKVNLTVAEKATLDALTSTLASCNAHLGGSAIGKGFRLAARYHLHKRAPNNIPLIGSSNQLSSLSLLDSSTSSSSKEIKSSTTTVNTPTSRHIQWDDSALEPGVQ